MRDIKFRGLTEDKKWVYGYYWMTKHKWFAIIKDEQTGEDFEVDPETVGQFTGMTDKNGKEIYESDIITCEIYEREEYNEYESDTPIVVSFGNGGFYPFTKAGQWRSSVKNIEVIGNIHEETEK